MIMSEPSKEFINPKALIAPGPAVYSHVAKVNRGTIVYISGQVPSDASGKIIGEGDFEAQVEQVFANLKIAVEAAGGVMADIVKLNYFLAASQHVRCRQPPDAPGLADRDRGGCCDRIVRKMKTGAGSKPAPVSRHGD